METYQDREYEDYKQRRAKENLMSDTVRNREKQEKQRSRRESVQKPESADGRRAGRFQPKQDEKLSPTRGGYEMPSNIYHSSGYKQTTNQLGSDPISAVRTLRNNMRQMALKYQDQDNTIKSHLANSSVESLTRTEGKLLQMNDERRKHLLLGDNDKAAKIMKQMQQVQESAVRDTYADLIMENEQMQAFGVSSKWTPDQDKMEGVRSFTPPPLVMPPDLPPSPPPEPDNYTHKGGRFRPRTKTPNPEEKKEKRETLIVKSRPPSVDSIRRNSRLADLPARTASSASRRPTSTTRMSPSPQQPPSRRSSATRDVKRNDRLATMTAAGVVAAPMIDNDDPYQPGLTAGGYQGSCTHCDMPAANSAFNDWDDHYKYECKMMSSCKYCGKISLVSELTDHQILRCPFLDGRMTDCEKCGLPIDAKDQAAGASHPMCRDRAAPEGARWCPLCAVAVQDDKKAWKQHLEKECYNNPRRNGPEPRRKPIRLPTPEPPPPPTPPVNAPPTPKSNNNRMIDADKLVQALQDIQKKKAVGGAAPPASAPPPVAPSAPTPAPANT